MSTTIHENFLPVSSSATAAQTPSDKKRRPNCENISFILWELGFPCEMIPQGGLRIATAEKIKINLTGKYSLNQVRRDSGIFWWVIQKLVNRSLRNFLTLFISSFGMKRNVNRYKIYISFMIWVIQRLQLYSVETQNTCIYEENSQTVIKRPLIGELKRKMVKKDPKK